MKPTASTTPSPPSPSPSPVTAMGTSVDETHRPQTVNFSAVRPPCSVLRHRLKETFFPEDPFRHFEGKSAGTKAWLAVKHFAPIFEWAPKYNLSTFRYDLLSGITIVSLAIPQGISYARLANIPSVIGLYSSFVPPIVYAIFGTSNNLAVGNVAAASLLLAATIEADVHQKDNPELYLQMFFTAAFFTGVFQLTLGLFRLGFLVDLFSRSTIIGFMSGTAVILILQQLKGIFGLSHFTHSTDIISVGRSIFSQTHQWRWQTAVLGLFFLTFLLFTQQLKRKKPQLFWVSAIAPLVVVIVGGIIAFVVKGEEHGIPIVGELDRGLNPITISQLRFESEYISTAMKAGLLTCFIALAEGIAVGRSLALLKNEQIDGNKEMIAFGMMNLVGSCTSCYLTSGPFSKSAVNFHAGCKTPMSNVVMSVCMMLVLLLLAPLFKYTPLVVLSTIIIVAMIGLIEYKEAFHLFKVDKFDFCICMAAFFGVVLVDMKTGLMLSVVLSIIRALLHVARPTTSKLGKLEGSDLYRDMEQYPNSSSHPGILILQLGSPLYFANAGYLREKISRWVEDEEKILKTDGEDLQYIILDFGGVISIDNPGIGVLTEVHENLGRRGIKVVLTNPRLAVLEKLVSSEFIELIGKEWVFLSVKDAVAFLQFSLQEGRSKAGHV